MNWLKMIYTVGHSNFKSFEEFRKMIYRMEVLVDVRSTPYSRYVPHFNRENIKYSLGTFGIEYHEMGNVLGGRPTDEDCYVNGNIKYEIMQEKEWYKEGISALIEILSRRRTVIMCSENDPYKCHRHHLISKTLMDMDVCIIHIIRGKHDPHYIEGGMKSPSIKYVDV